MKLDKKASNTHIKFIVPIDKKVVKEFPLTTSEVLEMF